MASDSSIQDSVEKTREAFRRLPESPPLRPDPRPEEPVAPAPAKGVTGLHPFFQGLIEALPEPGDEWPPAKREQWLETARNIFALIYTDVSHEPELIRFPIVPRSAPTADAPPLEHTA